MRPGLRALTYLFALTATLALVAACSSEDGGGGGDGDPKYGGSLTVTMHADNDTLDPPLVINSPDIAITQSVYDNLTLIQEDLTIKPMLATSWENSDDLLSYTFHLREGVKFHHGKDFTAEDVVYSFNRMLDPVLDSPARATMEVIESMDVIDDHTVRFNLATPSATFPEVVSAYQARIVPSDIDPSELITTGIGTGPFKLTEHIPGNRSILTKNEDYWEEGRPYLDEIVWLYIPDVSTRDEALKSGDVDVEFFLQHQSVPGIDANEGTSARVNSSSSFLTYEMDMRFPPFDNKLVRQAMQAATDREAINQAALLGTGSIGYDHPIPPNDPVFSTDFLPPEYDPELAKDLLAQAGYPDGIDITMWTATVGPGLVEMAVVMKEKAAPAGIRIDVQQAPEDIYWTEIWTIKPLAALYWNGRTPDQALSIEYMPGPWNHPRYDNPIVNDLIVKARGQVGLAERKATYGEIQRILIDEVPRIIPVFQAVVLGANDDVKGLEPHPMGWQVMTETWLDR
jgi:peptide/nickel transport system substrate-binding protein